MNSLTETTPKAIHSPDFRTEDPVERLAARKPRKRDVREVDIAPSVRWRLICRVSFLQLTQKCPVKGMKKGTNKKKKYPENCVKKIK